MDPIGAPSWVETEREHFTKFRDTDKDGFMNHAEVKNWIAPPDYDHTSAEAKHLIFESDIDKVNSFYRRMYLEYEIYRCVLLQNSVIIELLKFNFEIKLIAELNFGFT